MRPAVLFLLSLVLGSALLTSQRVSARYCVWFYGLCMDNYDVGRNGHTLACSALYRGRSCQRRGDLCRCLPNPTDSLLLEGGSDLDEI